MSGRVLNEEAVKQGLLPFVAGSAVHQAILQVQKLTPEEKGLFLDYFQEDTFARFASVTAAKAVAELKVPEVVDLDYFRSETCVDDLIESCVGIIDDIIHDMLCEHHHK